MVELAALLTLFATGAPADAVAIVEWGDARAIVRQTPDGDERLVYVRIGNPGDEPLTGATLVGAGARRDLITVPPGGCMDTLWLPADRNVVEATLLVGQEVRWEGLLEVGPLPGDAVRIEASPTVAIEQLQPLMLRGANYLPRLTPWPGLWREADRRVFQAEFAALEELFVNTLRTFYFFDTDSGLITQEGLMTPEILARIDVLLDEAEAHGMKVMICLGGALPPLEDHDTFRRFMRSGVEPFRYDGRVLMWDLINEPGGSEGPKATHELARWIQVMYPELVDLAPEHMITVGLAWQFDQLWDLGIQPPVGQFHNYSGAVAVQPEGEPPVRNVADDLTDILEFIDHRPLIVGEFGYTTHRTDARPDASDQRQLEIYEGVLLGAEVAGIAGVYNWIVFDFVPDWMGVEEQHFGVIRTDDSLKPAGVMLRDTYRRWMDNVRAPWELPRALQPRH
ncbi:MAG: cellulase family glycosylhydrolase [Armatimonadota bacterium]|jgi:hypothetical protein|nr:cellulase family glycosylhydrolase [candidate division WS1 bacterium]